MGHNRVTRVQVAALAGYSPNSGGFANLLGKLSSAGVISYPSQGMVELTQKGVATGNGTGWAAKYIRTNHEMLQTVAGHLTAPQRKILLTVHAVWPKDLARADVAERTQYSAGSGGFANLLGSLSSLGMITYPQTGRVKAADWMFVE